MNKILVFVFLLVSLGSLTAYQLSNNNNENLTIIDSKTLSITTIDPSFDIQLQIDQIDEDDYNLSATVKLDKGSYIISPYSTDSFYLAFMLSIPENNYFTTNSMLLEFPTSIPEIDPILNKPVRFVRKTTTYKQKIKVSEKDDFEVTGLIEFLLEPSCVPYDVEFTISNRSGKMEVKKMKTFISKEYKL